MSVTNQEGPLEPGKDTAEPPGNSYPLKGALFSFTVTKPVTLSRHGQELEKREAGGERTCKLLQRWQLCLQYPYWLLPLAESAELRGIEGVGHFLLGSA